MSEAKNKIKVLVVDDHPVVRQGLRAVLAERPNVQVVGEAGDGAEAMQKVKSLRPDIVLLDLSMPGMDGLSVTETLRQKYAQTKVLVLSIHGTPEHVASVMKAGARGYVIKGAPTDELVRAIQTVQSGGTFLSPAVAHAASSPPSAAVADGDPLAKLSDREREVLMHIAEGLSNKEIATRFDVSVRTIETHRERTMRKLKIHNVAGLTKFAVRHGLIALEAEKPA